MTVRVGGSGKPAFRAFRHRQRRMSEMVSRGMPARELKACAAIKKKKIIGSQRIMAAAVLALAVPALR